MFEALKVYFHPRQLIIALLGFSSGLPLALTSATLFLWLAEEGVDKTSIGFFASIATPYALKFLWSPVMDQIPFPALSRLLGRRRGWILATQIALMFSIVMMGLHHPAVDPWMVGLWAFVVAVCSASQDIVIDAYRVEFLKPEEQGAGAAMTQLGYRLGMLTSGAGALFLATAYGWQIAYFMMAALMGVGILTVLFSPEPVVHEKIEVARDPAIWIRQSVIEPFADFIKRDGWLAILLFVALYRIGDAFLGVMFNPFLHDIGFSKEQIAIYVKSFGLAATLLGIFLGGSLTYRFGTVRTLFVCGIVHAITNLLLVIQARLGADTHFLAISVGAENLSGGMMSAAFVAFISSLCKVRYTATQYALLSSLAAVGRTWLSTTSGWAAESLGWEAFFVLSAALAIPGLLLLWWVNKRYALEGNSLEK